MHENTIPIQRLIPIDGIKLKVKFDFVITFTITVINSEVTAAPIILAFRVNRSEGAPVFAITTCPF